MLSRSRLTLALLALLALLCEPGAGAATMKLFRGWAGPSAFSPKVAFNPNAGEFLILGQEFDELKTRRSGFSSEDQVPWAKARRSVGEWYGPAVLSYSPAAEAFLVAGYGYLRLDRRGRVLSEGAFPALDAHQARAATALGDSGEWFTLIEGGKYGFSYYGSIVGPQGDLRGDIPLNRVPFKAPVGGPQRWEVGYEFQRGSMLLLWEDNIGRHGSRSIRAHRLSPDGHLLGSRLDIVRDPKGAAQPHMVFHPKRREWLIVYVQQGTVRGRLLRGTKLSEPIRISGERSGVTPSIAYSPQRDLYLVTWVGSGDGSALFGQWVRANGRLLRRPFVISDEAGDQWVAEPGYSACNDSGACLVTWIDDGTDPGGIVRGRYVQVP